MMAKPKREKISLYKLLQMFPDEQAAEKFFENERWGKIGRYCPHCGSMRTVERKNRKPQPYRCKDCRKDFSIKNGSVMWRSKIPLHKWLMAMYLLSTSLKGVSSRKLASDLGIKQSHAWALAHKIRSAMEQGNGFFTTPVEADETYIGGLEKNKNADKKKNDGGGRKNRKG
ncbi:MAG: IS1595 family transposase, partial [Proteobacteria bacterium]|nr:IS1595 family transposase [Pseudomonadota bacterium]